MVAEVVDDLAYAAFQIRRRAVQYRRRRDAGSERFPVDRSVVRLGRREELLREMLLIAREDVDGGYAALEKAFEDVALPPDRRKDEGWPERGLRDPRDRRRAIAVAGA